MAPNAVKHSLSQVSRRVHVVYVSLGAEGVLPSRQIESFLRVFKQFTQTLPSRQVVGYLSICPPLWSQLAQWASCDLIQNLPTMRHFVKELWGFFHNFDQNLPTMCLSHSHLLRNVTTTYSALYSMSSLRVCCKTEPNWEFLLHTLKRTQWVCGWVHCE